MFAAITTSVFMWPVLNQFVPWFQCDTSLPENVSWFSAGKLKKLSCLKKELYHSTRFICALSQLCSLAAQCHQGYLSVLLLYPFICLLILPLKYPFCKINTACRQAANLLPWTCSSVHCQMRAGPAEGPVQQSIHSGCGVSLLWETSVFHQGFTSTCTSECQSCPRETNTHNLCLQGTLSPSGNFENLALCSYRFSVLRKTETRNPAPSRSQCKYCWWFQWHQEFP